MRKKERRWEDGNDWKSEMGMRKAEKEEDEKVGEGMNQLRISD